MNARDMLIKQLQALGADGLCFPMDRCGCGIDDLAPCDCMHIDECQAARWIKPKSDDSDYDDEFPEGYYKVI